MSKANGIPASPQFTESSNRSKTQTSRQESPSSSSKQRPIPDRTLPGHSVSQTNPPADTILILAREELTKKKDILEILGMLPALKQEWFDQIRSLEQRMRASSGAIISLVCASRTEKSMILKHAQEVERFCNSQCDADVGLLVLFVDWVDLELIDKLEERGADWLLLGPQPLTIMSVIELIQKRLSRPRHWSVVFRIKYEDSTDPQVFLPGRRRTKELPYGARTVDVLESLSPRWKTKKRLSDLTGIPVGYMNVHIHYLRKGFDQVRREAGVSRWGKSVFQSRKVGNRWEYRMMARIEKE